MAEHHFEVEEAKAHGIEKAILLHNLRWWLKKNKANRTNARDGFYWTYNSSKAFGELFPYMNQRSIRRWMQELEDTGVIMSGNYNKNPYDNTKWYTIPSEFEVPGQIDRGASTSDSDDQPMSEQDHSATENGQCITDSKPDSKPDTNTPPLSPDGGSEVEPENVFEKENPNTGLGGGAAEERAAKFRGELFNIGRTIYTTLMLERFYDYWTELDRGKKPKMRFEKQKVFEVKKRLAHWASKNLDGIQCYLTVEQKSIAEKKLAFKQALDPHLGRYGRDMLNAFYQHWSQAENGPNPTRLRWECEEFWDMANRLASWQSRNSKPKY